MLHSLRHIHPLKPAIANPILATKPNFAETRNLVIMIFPKIVFLEKLGVGIDENSAPHLTTYSGFGGAEGPFLGLLVGR